MTQKINITGCKQITPNKSVGQNVGILLRNKIATKKVIKIYEPNETINMIGIRFEIINNNMRIYTAHLKQPSTSSKEEISNQFDEIVKQVKEANRCNEGILAIMDFNIHVGNEIKNCKDKQDVGGKEVIKIIKNEGLILLNNTDICKGVVTRIDPRNGTKSTIDLAVCNEIMMKKITSMEIDENELIKPTNYKNNKITKTDHNTIIIKMKVEKLRKEKQTPRFNIKNVQNRQEYVELLNDCNLNDIFANKKCNMDEEYNDFIKRLEMMKEHAFEKVSVHNKMTNGITKEVKELLQEERNIRENVLQNPERGRKIYEIQQRIQKKIVENVEKECKVKIGNIINAKNPQSEVFKVRRNFKKPENIGFPLKDKNGIVRNDKNEIDKVINEHFTNVFQQNPVPKIAKWQKYWNNIDIVYNLIKKKCMNEYNGEQGPTYEEIEYIIKNLDAKKSVEGELNIDLLKLGNETLISVITRFINMCFDKVTIPESCRIENMTILYKQKGSINDLNNYRGIFIRNVFMIIYQKWMYSKCAPIMDEKGTEFAYGGRKNRSSNEALLIIKLVQDHSVWKKSNLVLKFLDIEKNFDTMNFKKAMILANESGIKGKYWSNYEEINKRKTCIPITPLGKSTEIKVKDVFVQGSNDAGLMAWNLADAINKKAKDICDPIYSCEGIILDKILFVDDMVQITSTMEDSKLGNNSLEVFQHENRIKFKTTKCKVLVMHQKYEEDLILNNKKIERKQSHTYLGTVISEKGGRKEDIKERIKNSRSIINEIVQICKGNELSKIRFKFVKLLTNACFDSKIKYSCQFWDNLSKSEENELNMMKINLMKRILEMPSSTPNHAVQHDFGIIDLALEVKAEKIILAAEIIADNKNKICKQLLKKMMEKKVPGFCTQVDEYINLFGCKSIEEISKKKNIREYIKKEVIQIQKDKLFKELMLKTKTNKIVINYEFNGKPLKYTEMTFKRTRAVFMLRSRMIKSKENFKGRWSNEICDYCGKNDTDEHMFTCPGYSDLTNENLQYETFFGKDMNIETLEQGADKLIKIIDRKEQLYESWA